MKLVLRCVTDVLKTFQWLIPLKPEELSAGTTVEFGKVYTFLLSNYCYFESSKLTEIFMFPKNLFGAEKHLFIP